MSTTTLATTQTTPARPTRTREKILLVNGDDFGLNRQMNHGIVDAASRGILTQATLLLGQPGTTQAVAMARRINLPLGLHLNLTEGVPCAPAAEIPSLARDGAFRNPGYVSGPEWDSFVQTLDVREVACELRAQVRAFEALVGKPPTHLDSHQVLSGHPHLLATFTELAATTGIPMRRPVWYRHPVGHRRTGQFFKPLPRRALPHPIKTTDHILFMGDLRTGGVPAVVDALKQLRPGQTALVTHPAPKTLPVKQKIALRHLDHELLTHPVVRRTVERENIRLSTFAAEHAPEPAGAFAAA